MANDCKLYNGSSNIMEPIKPNNRQKPKSDESDEFLPLTRAVVLLNFPTFSSVCVLGFAKFSVLFKS